jgi:hypothetical protein
MHVTRYEIGGLETSARRSTRPVRLVVLWILLGVVLPQILLLVIATVFGRLLPANQFVAWMQYATAFFVPPVYVAAWWIALRRPLSPSAVLAPVLVVFFPGIIWVIWIAMQQAFYGVGGRVFGIGIPWVLMRMVMNFSQALSAFATIWLCGRLFRMRLVGQDEKVYAKPLRIQDIMVVSIMVAVCLSLDSWLPAFRTSFGLMTGIVQRLLFTLLWAGVCVAWAFRSRRVTLTAAVGFLAFVGLNAACQALAYQSLASEQNLQGVEMGFASFLVGAFASSLLTLVGAVLVIWIAECHGYRLRIVPRESNGAKSERNAFETSDLVGTSSPPPQ